jgi:hypothetical protein
MKSVLDVLFIFTIPKKDLSWVGICMLRIFNKNIQILFLNKVNLTIPI